MGVPQDKCQHLDYAYLKGLGPYSLEGGQVQIVGDSLPAMSPFIYPTFVPPKIWHPVGTPNPLPKGQTATIRFRLTDPAEVKVEIVTVSDVTPAIKVIRTISDWSFTPPGTHPDILGLSGLQWRAGHDTQNADTLRDSRAVSTSGDDAGLPDDQLASGNAMTKDAPRLTGSGVSASRSPTNVRRSVPPSSLPPDPDRSHSRRQAAWPATASVR